MNTSSGQKAKIGIFTVAGILILVAGVFFIGSKKNLFSDTYELRAYFNNVGGLNVGNNIRFSGINVGTVQAINIANDTTIEVVLRMQEKVRKFLKADALASIGSDGLMGDKLITINPGASNTQRLLNNGDRIQSVNPVDFDKVIGRFTAVADNANVITGELANMMLAIKTGNGTISHLLYSDDLSKSLEGSAANAQRLTNSLAGITEHIQAGRGSLGELVYTDTLSNGLGRIMNTANYAMGTIQVAANNFSENMKALQSNYFLKGYFKRKAKEEKNMNQLAGDRPNSSNAPTANATLVSENTTNEDMDEEELKSVIAEAQRQLDAKRKKQ